MPRSTIPARLLNRPEVARLARRLGLEEPVRRARRAVDPGQRRAALDTANMERLLAHSLAADANCVDIGANRGDVTAVLARLAPGGRHHAFEPLPDLAQALRDRHPEVVVHQVALSDAPGTATYFRPIGADALSGLSPRNLAARHDLVTLEVQVARLDDLLPEDYVPAFIKVDVEGAELPVFRGARRILDAHHPTLWFEHGPGASSYFGADAGQLWDLLAGDLGYRVFDADGRGPLDRAAFSAVPERPMWTYVAHR